MLRTAGSEVQFGITRTSLAGHGRVSVADSIADVQTLAHEPSMCAEVRPARLHFRVLGLAVGRPVLPGCSTPSPVGWYRKPQSYRRQRPSFLKASKFLPWNVLAITDLE